MKTIQDRKFRTTVLCTLRAPLQATVIGLLLACTSLNLVAADKKLAKPPAESVQAINPTELKMHLEFLSSDQLGGRYTLSPNFAIAAEYLATRLKSYGFRGVGDNGSFMQGFDVLTIKADPEKSSLSVTIDGKSSDYAYGDYYNSGTKSGACEGQIAFVGYGISAPRLKHDDYAGLDVKGKFVIVVRGTPKDMDPSKLADEESGQEAAKAHGAIGIISIPSSPQFAGMMKADGFKQRVLQQESVRLAYNNDQKLPAITFGPAIAEKLLPQLDLTFESLAAKIKNGEPLPSKVLNASAKANIGLNVTTVKTQNVVGVLEGTDPQLKDEYVTFSAHYDHLKTGPKGEIYHGADDDGSGTSSVLAIAHALSLQRPKRSVFIIFHAGEELGLLGSQYNTDHAPAVPLDKILVDLNIDMIGRSKPAGDTDKGDEQLTDANTIYVIGANRISAELHEISETTNSDYEKLKFDYLLNNPSHPDRIYFRSDHWNYAKHGIPIIFYFDGIHVDYHKPTDTVDKIDFTKMTRVARLVFQTGWRIANLDHHLRKDAAAVAAK
jgi:Zn-dependent M28 family amino/carboxypeptidase